MPVSNYLEGDIPINYPPTGTPLNADPWTPKNHMGKAFAQYLINNLLGRETLGRGKNFAWYNRTKGEEGIYATPQHEMLLGEIDAHHGGGVFGKFKDDFMKSGTGGHVFGWGHYVSEEKGVAKYYKDLYQKEHGDFLHLDKQGNALKTQPKAAQYKVKLFKGKSPDEYSFLDWDKPVGPKRIAKVKAQAQKEGVLDEIESMGDISANAEHSGQALYKTVQLGFDSKEAASKFLNRAGIDGIRYPVGTLSGGNNPKLKYSVDETIKRIREMEPFKK